jgi:MEMO1 family protein
MRWSGILPVLCIVALVVGCADVDAGPGGAKRPAAVGKPAQTGGGPNQEAGDVKEHRSGDWTPGLSEEEKTTLFAIANDTLSWCVNRSKEPFSFEKYGLTDKLKARCATFVTLKKSNGDLRGCIGSLAPVDAMYKSVHGNAVNASMRDHRFAPVSPAELERIDVHISLLSPIVEIPSADDFKIGAHGIIVSKNGRRGVFLPEVAVEQKWTREQTLNYLCAHKAGLAADAWKEGAKLEVFSSVVLSLE